MVCGVVHGVGVSIFDSPALTSSSYGLHDVKFPFSSALTDRYILKAAGCRLRVENVIKIRKPLTLTKLSNIDTHEDRYIMRCPSLTQLNQVHS